MESEREEEDDIIIPCLTYSVKHVNHHQARSTQTRVTYTSPTLKFRSIRHDRPTQRDGDDTEIHEETEV